MDECLRTKPSPGAAACTEPTQSQPGCLSDSQILAFAEGRLGAATLEKFDSHLDQCPICRRLTGEALRGSEPEIKSDEDLTWNTVFRPQSMVARRYRIRRFIARGGMGEVYDAYDCDLHERVALKTVTSTTCDDPRAVRRLKSEVQMAHCVNHPSVCRIFDFGTHTMENGVGVVHYLTMEYIDGVPLGKRLRASGALSVDEAVAMARQLLEGLRAAHRAGILHRDFKSDNVMLRVAPDGELTPVILDFGLARSLNPDVAPLTSEQNRGLIGTLSYMAPEQIEGKPLSPASDLYAFGVVWFEMLTGRLPFVAETAAANALERLVKEPPAPSSLRPLIPKALDEILLRCLARDPEARYQSPDEVLFAIDRIEGHGTLTFTPAPVPAPLRSAPTRSVRATRSGIILGLAIGLPIAVWLASHRRLLEHQPATTLHAAQPLITAELQNVAAPAPSGALAQEPSPTPSTKVSAQVRRHQSLRVANATTPSAIPLPTSSSPDPESNASSPAASTRLPDANASSNPQDEPRPEATSTSPHKTPTITFAPF